MEIQHVQYAVHGRDYKPKVMGCGYTNKARFIFHFWKTAFCWGKHPGRTWVIELFTTGTMLRFRLLQTKE